MNTFQLSCFLAVAEHLNFARAAEELHVTQPAVTQQIHSLEKELGATLFQRTTRKVSLTAEGLAFLSDAQANPGPDPPGLRQVRPPPRPAFCALRLGECVPPPPAVAGARVAAAAGGASQPAPHAPGGGRAVPPAAAGGGQPGGRAGLRAAGPAEKRHLLPRGAPGAHGVSAAGGPSPGRPGEPLPGGFVRPAPGAVRPLQAHPHHHRRHEPDAGRPHPGGAVLCPIPRGHGGPGPGGVWGWLFTGCVPALGLRLPPGSPCGAWSLSPWGFTTGPARPALP